MRVRVLTFEPESYVVLTLPGFRREPAIDINDPRRCSRARAASMRAAANARKKTLTRSLKTRSGGSGSSEDALSCRTRENRDALHNRRSRCSPRPLRTLNCRKQPLESERPSFAFGRARVGNVINFRVLTFRCFWGARCRRLAFLRGRNAQAVLSTWRLPSPTQDPERNRT
jgi:hypothetical protein